MRLLLLSFMFFFLIPSFNAQSKSTKKTYISFTINGKKKDIKNAKLFLTTDENKEIQCKINKDNVIEFPLSDIDKNKKYTINFICCNSTMKFKNISYNFLQTDQDREFQFEVERRPFKKAKNLTEEEYKEKRLSIINFLKVNPYERGDGIMLLEKIYR